MSTVPIPQGASVGEAQAPQSVPIPAGASIGTQGDVITDSDNPKYVFKNPALTPEEMKKLQAANGNRSFINSILGLQSDDPEIQALEKKNLAHQTESAQNSSFVKQQFKDKAAGGAAVATLPLAGAAAAGTAAATAPTAVTATVGTGILDSAGAEIMKDVTTLGPSVAKAALTKLGPPAIKWATGAAAGALGFKWLSKFL